MAEPDIQTIGSEDASRTLHVRLESADEFFDRVQEMVEVLEAGEAADGTASLGLSLPDEQALARVFSVPNLELIRAIAEQNPGSMRELAELVDRDIKNVSRNLHELDQLGLVELVDDGRAKRPVVPYDEIEVRYPVRSRDPDGDD